MENKKIRNIICFSFIILAFVLFSGCGLNDKKKSENNKNETIDKSDNNKKDIEEDNKKESNEENTNDNNNNNNNNNENSNNSSQDYKKLTDKMIFIKEDTLLSLKAKYETTVYFQDNKVKNIYTIINYFDKETTQQLYDSIKKYNGTISKLTINGNVITYELNDEGLFIYSQMTKDQIKSDFESKGFTLR